MQTSRPPAEPRAAGATLPGAAWHGDAVGEFLTGRGNAQQFVGRSVQADADLLQRVDRGSGLAAGDGAEISGAEVAEFGSGFIG